MLRNSINKLIRKEYLSPLAYQQALEEVFSKNTNHLQVIAFLVLLRAKPETTEELIGLITAIRGKMLVVPTKHRTMDIVGTGGDGTNTINISTGSAILAASCGIRIAKHGNRAVSSLTGTADVLEALGIAINLSAEKISMCIDEAGIGFCFFPNFHPAIQEIRNLGKQLKIPTALNFLGTLLNPANAAHYLLGVFEESLLPIIANVLKETGNERSIVAHSCGLDEISCVGPTKIIEITATEKKLSVIDPVKLGLDYCSIDDLRGGTAIDNAKLLLAVFSGKKSKKLTAIANTLILNSAVALYIYGTYSSIEKAIPHARENLYNGSALKTLNRFRECSHA